MDTETTARLEKMPEWMLRYCKRTPESAALRFAYLAEADARAAEVAGR